MTSRQLDALLGKLLFFTGYFSFALATCAYFAIVYLVVKDHWSFFYNPAQPHKFPDLRVGTGDALVVAMLTAVYVFLISILLLVVNHKMRWANLPIILVSLLLVIVPPLVLQPVPPDIDERWQNIMPQPMKR